MSIRDVTRFLDADGAVEVWPSKQTDKQLVIAYLATKFSPGIYYTESQINEVLKQWHTFSDWPLLRRELYDGGFLGRASDGSKYWLTDKTKEKAPE